jgi:uncharacterized protein with HEPN domain
MHDRDWRDRIRHIIENIERVQGFIQGMSCESFCADEKTSFAVVTCFSIIGEAARLVPQQVKETHSDIPWNQMTRMRNLLVHEYERIDPQILWRTVNEDLAQLLPKIRALFESH